MKTGLFLIIGLIGMSYNALSQEKINIHAADNGIRLEENNLFISPECKRLLSDQDYRQSIYPENYTFEQLPNILAKNRILGLWYIINLYEQAPLFAVELTKDLIISTQFKSSEFVDAFYTYAYADPRFVSIKDGEYALMQPELLENCIETTNLLVHYAKRLESNSIETTTEKAAQ